MARLAMDERLVLRATELLKRLELAFLDVLTLGAPKSGAQALERMRVVSKLSPLVANSLEFEFVAYLNAQDGWLEASEWVRQDPDFPDLSLRAERTELAGIEVKAWFPLSTEMTGRFRESQVRLRDSPIRVMVVAWLPEFIVYGRPMILDIWDDRAINLARARDEHHHKPPWYLVVEPEDTSERTRNLQQTNCAGYVFQGTEDELAAAADEVDSWGRPPDDLTDSEYQGMLRDLMGSYRLRLDTNFAKIDRVAHEPLEQFKSQVLSTDLHGRTIAEWRSRIATGDESSMEELIGLSSQTP